MAIPTRKTDAHRTHQTWNPECSRCRDEMTRRAARYAANATREIGRMMREARS